VIGTEVPLVDSAGRTVQVAIEVHTPCAPQPLPPCPWQFPDVRGAPPEGLAGAGGDFEPSTIVAAYRSGIFPWPHPDEEHLWFSPDPRAVLPLDGLVISQRLGRTVRSGRFRVTIDAAFEAVMRGCADRPGEGTWITPALIRGYTALQELGWAHSVEVWNRRGDLAGGLYGVCVGAMFGAESMFHRETDASKVAMVALVQHARRIGIQLIDIQVLTSHTERMGGAEISRAEYLRRLGRALTRQVEWRAGRQPEA
jgi:leucyl/phenylalanyl-tRNA--protein transferase